jgi:hypothetical protein
VSATPVERGARPERVIAVLGMHRSGTSALVGSLQQRGLFLGRHRTSNTYNLRGNRENPDVMRLHGDVLRDSGGSWHAPPATVEWGTGHLQRARAILGEYAAQPLWGFKDPRTLLTIDGWLQLVPDMEFVGVFRHPARVARSLAARPQLPVEDPIGLWSRYNERLLELHQRRPFPVVSFDDDAETLERNLTRMAAELGLSADATQEPFFRAELRRMDDDAEGLPPAAMSLYDELRALSL